MSVQRPWVSWVWRVCWVLWVGLSSAHAHLIVSQRGTLNIVESGIYMVLSLPVSAFTGIDDDGDGLLSLDELRTHTSDIDAQVRRGIELADPQKTYPLDGVMLNTVPTDEAPAAPAPQVAVLGRFAVDPGATGLMFSMRLFGTGAGMKMEQVSVTRGAETQLMTLTPERAQRDVLPSSGVVFGDQVRQGMHHILFGWDHLLFLGVMLSAGWGVRQLVLLLTCFTVGHALSLSACVLWGLDASSALVEPAIAATIVGAAGFDRWSALRDKQPRAELRFMLVFACAFVHGLGLAGALTELGIDPMHKIVTLLGFNLGVEIGQLGVAAVAVFALNSLVYVGGAAWAIMSRKVVSYAAMGMGAYWLIGRVFII